MARLSWPGWLDYIPRWHTPERSPISVLSQLSVRLRSHRYEYENESGFPFMVHRSFTRRSGAFTVTCTSTQLNACRPYWIKSNRGNASRINNNILLQSYYKVTISTKPLISNNKQFYDDVSRDVKYAPRFL